MSGSARQDVGSLSRRWQTHALFSLAIVAGCSSSERADSRQLLIDSVDTLITAESGLLASPVDIVVDERGAVLVLDRQSATVLRLPREGGGIESFGSEGQGPGEFRRPSVIVAGADTVRVLDTGNGRVQVLSPRGDYVRSYPLSTESGLNHAFIAVNGSCMVATGGLRGVLAARYDPDGQFLSAVGEAIVPPVAVVDFPTMKREAASGVIPQVLRNQLRPVLGSNGEVWLVLTAEGVVKKYDAADSLVWERALEDPEMAYVMERFRTRNRESQDPSRFTPLVYVSDAVEHDGSLWMLMYGTEARPAVVLGLSSEGSVAFRLVIPGAGGAGALAVDAQGRTLYLAVPSAATLLRVSLPNELPG